jgi:hypothetical protein
MLQYDTRLDYWLQPNHRHQQKQQQNATTPELALQTTTVDVLAYFTPVWESMEPWHLLLSNATIFFH